ncbi:hypothetical protein FACS1894153_4020 [Bacteroidia bacterium]|nr:hypothetical protein FACS1894153_4020 [Bacteroidia bacterium]
MYRLKYIYITIAIITLCFATKFSSAQSQCDPLISTDSTLLAEQIPDTMLMCRRDTIMFPNLQNYNYYWSNQTSQNYYIINSAGIISVRISVPSNPTCWRIDTINIIYQPKPILEKPLNIDTALCLGDSILLNIGGQKNVINYSWNIPTDPDFQSEDTAISVKCDSLKFSSGIYKYIVTMRGICYKPVTLLEYTIYDTAFIFFKMPPIVDLGKDSTYCPEEESKLTALDKAYFDVNFYDITWDGNPSRKNNNLSVDTGNMGLHYVVITNGICGDTAIDSIDIKFWNPKWTASNLVKDTGTCDKVYITLDASVPYPQTTYLWLHDSSTNPVITVKDSKTYSVELTDSAGCLKKFSAIVQQESCEAQIEMPNIFTPNGDGINDYFLPTKQEKVEDFNIKIYSRMGLVVYDYKGDAEQMKWDGTNNGSPVATGVYFWSVKYKDLYGKHFQHSGSVTLLR